MKKTLLTILLLVACTYSYSQTTNQEFLYLQNGIKDYLYRGYDIKPGYFLAPVLEPITINFPDARRTVKVYEFFREADKRKPCAILLVYYKEGGSYVHIPIPTDSTDEQMWQKIHLTLSDLNDTGSALQTISWALIKYSSRHISS